MWKYMHCVKSHVKKKESCAKESHVKIKQSCKESHENKRIK